MSAALEAVTITFESREVALVAPVVVYATQDAAAAPSGSLAC